MIGYVVLWLALAGGPKHTQCCTTYWQGATADQGMGMIVLPPKEHVIEIRTKRKRELVAWQGPGPYNTCPVGFVLAIETDKTLPKGLEVSIPPLLCEKWESVSVRKTLYIDGQKVGVIKEVEEK